MKRLNKIALSVMAVVVVGISFSGCDKDRVSSSNVGNKLVLGSKIALARNDVFVAQRAIEDRVFIYDISATQLMKPKAPNGERGASGLWK